MQFGGLRRFGWTFVWAVAFSVAAVLSMVCGGIAWIARRAALVSKYADERAAP